MVPGSNEQPCQGLEQTLQELSSRFNIDLQPGFPLRLFLETTINTIMRCERDIFLSGDPENKANGFYSRSVNTAIGKLHLSVPRDRKCKFRPQIIPDKYVRNDESFAQLLQFLLVDGHSDSSLRNTLEALGLSYSQSDLDRIVSSVKRELKLFKERQLPKQIFALFIKAYHWPVKDDSRVSEHTYCIVVGISSRGEKDIFGVYTFLGGETSIDWNLVLRDLFDRGLKEPCVVIADDFPSLRDELKIVFPNAFIKNVQEFCAPKNYADVKRRRRLIR